MMTNYVWRLLRYTYLAYSQMSFYAQYFTELRFFSYNRMIRGVGVLALCKHLKL